MIAHVLLTSMYLLCHEVLFLTSLFSQRLLAYVTYVWPHGRTGKLILSLVEPTVAEVLWRLFDLFRVVVALDKELV